MLHSSSIVRQCVRGVSTILLMGMAACGSVPAALPGRLSESAPAAIPLPVSATGQCQLVEPDQQWLDRSVAAWRRVVTGPLIVRQLEPVEALIFDKACVLQSGTAMAGGPTVWIGRLHNGQVTLPDAAIVPAHVTSFAGSTNNGAFFVMAAPSIWRQEGVTGGAISLENLMTAVMLHEASHMLQFRTYGQQIEQFVAHNNLPENFTDDSIQVEMENEAEFASSMTREIELLFASASAPDHASALRLARAARALMSARHLKHYKGERAHLRIAEDLWLSMEGSGQWLGYQWLIDPNGAAVPQAVALDAFAKRGRWWSQKQGIALFFVLDRLTREDWKARAFGDGARTAMEMFDAALSH